MHRSSDVVFRCGGGYCVRMILFFTYTRFVCTINKRLKDYKFSSFAASYFFTWFLPHLFNHLPASLLRCFLSFFRSFSLIKQFLNLRFYSIFFGSKCCFVVVVGVAAALSHFSSHRWLLLSLLRSFVVFVVVISFSFFLLFFKAILHGCAARCLDLSRALPQSRSDGFQFMMYKYS